MRDTATPALPRRIILGFMLGGLLILSFAVLRLFIVPIIWATILGFVTWPIYLRLRRLMRGSANGSALVMTLLLTACFVLPVLWLITLMRGETANTYQAIGTYLSHGPHPLPDFIANIPFFGPWVQEFFNQFSGDPAKVQTNISHLVEQRAGNVLNFLGGVGHNAAKFGLSLVTVFFIYRDGESLLGEIKRALQSVLGTRVNAYLEAAGDTTKGVVWGLLATSIAQGLLAGLGYWWAGLAAPLLLSAITALVALIPFGTPFIWGSAGIWLIATGHTLEGVGLLLWGTLIVSWVDNLIRPLVISGATSTHFLLVLFGVLGGLAAFGMVGLFVGPVILAVLMAVWREWLDETGSTPPRKSAATKAAGP
jgi:predicted PurR-regulated permease PerM